MKRLLHTYLRLLKGRDKGTVAITFLLSLPVLLTVIGVLVQFALLANARLTLDRAAAAAARSAMTSLPTDAAIDVLPVSSTNNVNRSALMILESLSPVSPDVTSDAATVADALAQTGVVVPPTYAARYSFAQNATQVSITPLDLNGNPAVGMKYAQHAAPRARITVSYDFQITVPFINIVIGRNNTVAGVTGRFLTLSSTLDNIQLSPGREATDGGGGTP